MASSKLVTTNPDLPRQSSICSLSTMLADLQQQQHQQNPSSSSKALAASMSMDDLLKNLYSSDQTSNQLPLDGSSSISPQGSFSQPKELGDKTVDDVWKEIVAGNGNQRQAGAEEAGNDADSGQLEEMTLEDFLTKAGAVREEDVRSGAVVPDPGGYGVDSSAAVAMNGGPFALQGVEVGHTLVPFDGRVVVGGAVGGGRGKRRAVEEPVVDKATQQRQKRMIKNRESAARSRERKQAYTVELESLVTQLEEENARLLREEAYQNKERFKQLMQNLIPVVEKRRPPRTLRRVQSVHW